MEFLSWQGESGCWPTIKEIEADKLWDELRNIHRGRKLLYEKVLPGLVLFHHYLLGDVLNWYLLELMSDN